MGAMAFDWQSVKGSGREDGHNASEGDLGVHSLS